MTVEERIRRSELLSPSEHRVAEEILLRPQLIAFGTVAALARTTGTSGATVVRLATKLGFEGFADMQGHVQEELATRLGPAANRIDEDDTDDLLTPVPRGELANVEATLRGVDREALDRAVELISRLDRHVYLLPGDCARGPALHTVDHLFALRPGVTLIEGNQLEVGRAVAGISKGDVVIAIDFARYDRTVLRAASLAVEQGAALVSLSDSPLSPQAKLATASFVVSNLGVGPFDSQVATMAMCQVLVAATAQALKSTAARRLRHSESTWQLLDAVTDAR